MSTTVSGVTGPHVCIGKDELVSTVCECEVGDEVEVEYQKDGDVVTISGEITSVDDSRDIGITSYDIWFDGVVSDAYLHVNTKNGIYSFFDGSSPWDEYSIESFTLFD